MNSEKHHPVWQLTDGTVVLQGMELSEEKIRTGAYTFRSAEKSVHSKSPLREKLFSLLEKV